MILDHHAPIRPWRQALGAGAAVSVAAMTLTAISWDDTLGVAGQGGLRVLDQTLLPARTEHRLIVTTADLVTAIADLAVRGAPALGVAGAFGVVLALDEGARLGWSAQEVDAAIETVRAARPTAVNLAWGVDRVRPLAARGRDAVLAEARRIASEDEAANRRLARLGADWILERVPRSRLRVLTHCNTGALATAGWGTAIGVIRELHARGRLELVHVDESRPLLQGSRLTAYELAEADIPHVLQVDGAAAATILGGRIDVAVVGADRVARNGDTANKIGTLAVALACAAAGIPFVVAAPWSSIDLTMADASAIEIEERPAREVTCVAGVAVAPPGTQVANPAFDVTPARLVTALVTERGVVEPARGVGLAPETFGAVEEPGR